MSRSQFAVLLAVAMSMTGCLYNVDNGEIVVMQDPWDGEMHIYTTPGTVQHNFAAVQAYPKSEQYWFTAEDDTGDERDQSISVRFNDGGHGQISGSLRVELPLDLKQILDIHTQYRSWEAVEKQLVRPAIERSVYMAGPLMSSRESAAERRADLIRYIEDQLINGIYKTSVHERKVVDILTGAEKSVTEAVIDMDSDGRAIRQEPSTFIRFGIRVFNLAVNQIKYEATVEKQIRSRQDALMQVEVAIAEARKAEQRKITTEQEGMANAAKSKWEQEVVKAKMVTEAQQKLEVADLDRRAAEQKKAELILLGQGEAERKRLVMAADGALTQKLDAWLEAQRAYATSISAYSGAWVPSVVMGSGDSTSNGAQALIDLLTAKTARDIGLDLTVPRGSAPKPQASTSTKSSRVARNAPDGDGL